MSSRQDITGRKLTLGERLQLWAAPLIVTLYQRFVGLTSKRFDYGRERVERLREEGRPWIYGIWHTNVLFSPYLLRNQNVAVLVSASRDGELITRAVERMGNFTIRGSTSKGGVGALKAMVRHQKKGGAAAFTPDGPRGPAFRVQPGIITSAQISGSPIVPFHYECTRQWIAEKSWDKHRIPKPFTAFHVSFGEPIHVPPEMNAEQFEAVMARVEKALLANKAFCESKAKSLD